MKIVLPLGYFLSKFCSGWIRVYSPSTLYLLKYLVIVCPKVIHRWKGIQLNSRLVEKWDLPSAPPLIICLWSTLYSLNMRRIINYWWSLKIREVVRHLIGHVGAAEAIWKMRSSVNIMSWHVTLQLMSSVMSVLFVKKVVSSAVECLILASMHNQYWLWFHQESRPWVVGLEENSSSSWRCYCCVCYCCLYMIWLTLLNRHLLPFFSPDFAEKCIMVLWIWYK